MKIMVVAASKHGSTQEIAEAIGVELRQAGHQVTVYEAKDKPAVIGYEAAVIGSAVYAGSWLGEAHTFVAENQAALQTIPVWLFTSGPLGEENPQPVGDPTQLPELLAQTNARDHRIFVGKLDRDKLNLGEKLIVKVVKAPYGDFRDWDDIQTWAGEVGKALLDQ
ncbi:MAG: flavodoxin domain-containing protein [Chloroflexota bacterium]|jgi:menaquinone-dependent protoporphyrinogen oxidase